MTMSDKNFKKLSDVTIQQSGKRMILKMTYFSGRRNTTWGY